MNEPWKKRNTEAGAAKGWPEKVRIISVDELDRLGIHNETNQLYWDGKPIVTRRDVALRWYERLLATVVAVATTAAAAYPYLKWLGYLE